MTLFPGYVRQVEGENCASIWLQRKTPMLGREDGKVLEGEDDEGVG
jgi:hypothetical protein